jgi:hypothetical protein
LDSGATIHVTNDLKLLINARKTEQFVKVGNGADAEATFVGQVAMIVEDNKRLRLTEVLFVPGLIWNVISLSKIVSNGVTVELHDGFVTFKTGDQEWKLQKASNESMWTITSTTVSKTDEAMVIDKNANKRAIKKMNIMEAHEKLGHPDEKTTRLTVESFGWEITREMEPCNACLWFKAKAKRVSHKPTTTRATKAGERLFMDTTGPYEMSAGGTKYDIHVVDQQSDMGWLAHVVQRSGVPQIFEQHWEILKGKGMPVKYLCCDNAGEHQKKLKRICERHGVDIEYTPSNTPPRNGVAERRIASTNRYTYTMLHGGRFNERFRLRLRAEAKTTSNKLRNIYIYIYI